MSDDKTDDFMRAVGDDNGIASDSLGMRSSMRVST